MFYISIIIVVAGGLTPCTKSKANNVFCKAKNMITQLQTQWISWTKHKMLLNKTQVVRYDIFMFVRTKCVYTLFILQHPSNKKWKCLHLMCNICWYSSHNQRFRFFPSLNIYTKRNSNDISHNFNTSHTLKLSKVCAVWIYTVIVQSLYI